MSSSTLLFSKPFVSPDLLRSSVDDENSVYIDLWDSKVKEHAWHYRVQQYHRVLTTACLHRDIAIALVFTSDPGLKVNHVRSPVRLILLPSASLRPGKTSAPFRSPEPKAEKVLDRKDHIPVTRAVGREGIRSKKSYSGHLSQRPKRHQIEKIIFRSSESKAEKASDRKDHIPVTEPKVMLEVKLKQWVAELEQLILDSDRKSLNSSRNTNKMEFNAVAFFLFGVLSLIMVIAGAFSCSQSAEMSPSRLPKLDHNITTAGVPDLSFLPEPVVIRASSNGLLCCM
nr:F-box protein At5g07610-like [Ipomoea batatas]